jgi:hypothetical protein
MNLLQGKWQIAVNDIAEHTSQWETFSILLRHEAGQAFTDVRRGKRAARSAMNDVEALALVRKIFFPLPVKQHREIDDPLTKSRAIRVYAERLVLIFNPMADAPNYGILRKQMNQVDRDRVFVGLLGKRREAGWP